MNFPAQRILAVLIGMAIITGANLPIRAADDPLAWPPIAAQQKPWAFNWWMGSAVDKTNLTHELERYAAAGLGGIHIIPIYGAKGFEDKYITYLSPQWMEMMGWAVSEARRLGMDVDMTTGTGWCFGGPQVTDDEANANVVVKTYDVKAGEKLEQKYSREVTQALVAYAPDGKAVELTDKISAEGAVDWTAPAGGTWTVYAISQKPSGQKVKRPAPGGEGWMLNLFYPHAMDDFLKPYTAAFANYHGPKPRAQFHDSYEYRSDWSPVFFAEFEQRRGYRLQTELPALFSKTPDEHAARVLCDYRQTVSEIMAEETLPAWTKWAHAEGFITRDQAHGSPGNWLDLYAAADIPETEMFHSDRSKLISKFASSAAHVMGKPLVSSETGTWLEEHFTEKLSDVKYLFDDMFLSGINHMFYHGCCYSPDEAGWPGWHFYASTEMNPRNSIWHDADAVNAYAARCQSILQSGQPDNDILLYWPIEDFWMQPGDKLLPQLTVHARDWFEGQPIGEVAQKLYNAGLQFDYVSDSQLERAKAIHGAIEMPGGNYRVVVVPKCKYIPLTTMQRLYELGKSGATVIFLGGLPKDISGAKDIERQRQELQKLQAAVEYNDDHVPAGEHIGLFEPLGTHTGRWFIFDDEQSIVSSLISIAPAGKRIDIDVTTNMAPIERSGLYCIRRAVPDGRYYFIANRGETNFDGWIELASFYVNYSPENPASVIILDPMTGKSGVVARNEDGKIHLQLAAGESVILRAFADKKVEGPAWNYWQTNGQPVEIGGHWNVKFTEGGPTLPADFQTAKLASWTTFPDTNAQAFAGTAKYEATFDAQNIPGRVNAELQTCAIDLGDVRQSAHVWVNGKDYGKLIMPPFRVMVDHLKPAGNQLEVEVTSVAANRIRDLDRRGVKWKVFRDINIVDINYKPFDASNWPLTDCGLLGPVTVTLVSNQK
ncbi:MAG: glycosyl hydrolase [Verrucomicrobiae bacterium]|nr:glycosyl hydrolase [Verrucomicrobiae bacterium]